MIVILGSRGILTTLGRHSVPVTVGQRQQCHNQRRFRDRETSQVPNAHAAINLAIQLPGRRETTNQGGRTAGKDEEIGKDGAVWTESRGRRQSQNALIERHIQDSQSAFLCVVDAKMLIRIHGCSVAEARRVLGYDSSSDMSVDELNAFLALYVHEVKGGCNIELSSFWSD
ncbi:hypothetical protein CRENBAI_006226 [Crenichthys baileyi]|uniref:Uncharacterized protein n=1 Tax=Crenichthys baileyi TaxID=28760 RepID=A0AAV9RBM3_9TELE